jgi:hypothetical protein
MRAGVRACGDDVIRRCYRLRYGASANVVGCGRAGDRRLLWCYVHLFSLSPRPFTYEVLTRPLQ